MSEKQEGKDLGRFFSFPGIIRAARGRAKELSKLAKSPFLSPEQKQSAESAGVVASQQAEDAEKRMAKIEAAKAEKKLEKEKPSASGQ